MEHRIGKDDGGYSVISAKKIPIQREQEETILLTGRV
jgi:hypothetical protein